MNKRLGVGGKIGRIGQKKENKHETNLIEREKKATHGGNKNLGKRATRKG